MQAVKGCYTLLADDNCSFSNDVRLLGNFKAHLVYNLILNGRLAFSDNQVICSSNLQALASTDTTIIALFENGYFDLAIRSAFTGEDGPATLASVHDAFVREDKIRHTAKSYQESPALSLIDRCAKTVTWSYADVRMNFTHSCERLLQREFRPLLDDLQFETFNEIILAEKERDSGLGREFLQNRLHRQMQGAGIVVDKSRRDLIHRCTDAPYLSNLPAAIGLNPIYGEEHRSSFELVRGGSHDMETMGSVNAPSRFDYEHHVAGLCRLTIDDIQSLQELPARKRYLTLSGSLGKEADYHEAFDAFVEFNLLVEDRIAARFPEIARRSPGDPDRRFLKQKAKTYAAAAAEDVFGILVGMFAPVPLSICKQLILDICLRPADDRPRSLEAGEVSREVAQRRLAAHLQETGAAAAIKVEDRSNACGPFSKEIIVS